MTDEQLKSLTNAMTGEEVENFINALEVGTRAKLIFHAEQVEARAQNVATDADMCLRASLDSVNGGFPGHPGQTQPEIFRDVVRYAALAFPDDTPTNVQILTNSATPDLVRYLLRSLRSSQKPRKTREHKKTTSAKELEEPKKPKEPKKSKEPRYPNAEIPETLPPRISLDAAFLATDNEGPRGVVAAHAKAIVKAAEIAWGAAEPSKRRAAASKAGYKALVTATGYSQDAKEYKKTLRDIERILDGAGLT